MRCAEAHSVGCKKFVAFMAAFLASPALVCHKHSDLTGYGSIEFHLIRLTYPPDSTTARVSNFFIYSLTPSLPSPEPASQHRPRKLSHIKRGNKR